MQDAAEFEDSCGSLKGLSNLYDPQEHPKTHIRDIADVLLDMGRITDASACAGASESSRPKAAAMWWRYCRNCNLSAKRIF